MNWLDGPFNRTVAVQQLRAIATALEGGLSRLAAAKRLLRFLAWLLPMRAKDV